MKITYEQAKAILIMEDMLTDNGIDVDNEDLIHLIGKTYPSLKHEFSWLSWHWYEAKAGGMTA